MDAPHGSVSGAGSSPGTDGRSANGRNDAGDAPTANGRAERRFALPHFAPSRGERWRASQRAAGKTISDVPSIGDDGSETDWRSLGVFAAGLAVGALFGAGAALLLAPASGFETRARLARGARRARTRAADRIENVGDRVRDRAKRGRRSLKRKMTLSRWRAEDAWDRHRSTYRDA